MREENIWEFFGMVLLITIIIVGIYFLNKEISSPEHIFWLNMQQLSKDASGVSPSNTYSKLSREEEAVIEKALTNRNFPSWFIVRILNYCEKTGRKSVEDVDQLLARYNLLKKKD